MSDTNRRKLLKSLAAGSGAVIAGKSLPESWTKPVVDSVLLPAHAQTSQFIYDLTLEADPCSGGGQAAITSLDFNVTGITPLSNGTVDAFIQGDNGDPDEYYFVSIEGNALGQIGPAPGGDGTSTTASFPVSQAILETAAADGTISITFTPNTPNEIDCGGPFPYIVRATLTFTGSGTPPAP